MKSRFALHDASGLLGIPVALFLIAAVAATGGAETAAGGQPAPAADAVAAAEAAPAQVAAPVPAAAPAVSEAEVKRAVPPATVSAEPKREARPAVSPARVAKYLRSAEQYYWDGDLETARKMADRVLSADPLNEAAQKFRDKIETLVRRQEDVRRDTAEQFYYRSETFLKRGDLLNALYWSNLAVQTNPSFSKANALNISIYERCVGFVSMASSADREIYVGALRDFLQGNYEAASETFRDISRAYPEISSFVGATTIHFADSRSRDRSDLYYEKARIAMSERQFINARDHLRMAIDMDRTNLPPRQALEQLNMELDLPRISVLGQD